MTDGVAQRRVNAPRGQRQRIPQWCPRRSDPGHLICGDTRHKTGVSGPPAFFGRSVLKCCRYRSLPLTRSGLIFSPRSSGSCRCSLVAGTADRRRIDATRESPTRPGSKRRQRLPQAQNQPFQPSAGGSPSIEWRGGRAGQLQTMQGQCLRFGVASSRSPLSRSDQPRSEAVSTECSAR